SKSITFRRRCSASNLGWVEDCILVSNSSENATLATLYTYLYFSLDKRILFFIYFCFRLGLFSSKEVSYEIEIFRSRSSRVSPLPAYVRDGARYRPWDHSWDRHRLERGAGRQRQCDCQ